jgi:signal transduction histidine kinase
MTTDSRLDSPLDRTLETDPDRTAERAVDETLTALTRLATRLCGVPHAVVNLLDGQHQYQVAATGAVATTCSAEDSLCGRVVADRRLVVVTDARADPRLRDSPFVDEQRDSLQVLADRVVEVIEQRRVTRWLDLALAELTRSNAVLTDFAGRLSHDLKTPLTAVLGFAEVLETLPAVEDDPRAVRYVGRIVRSGSRMRVLIDDLLSFAAVGGGTTVIAVDLEPLVAAVADDLAPLVRGRGATVTASDTTVMADPVQLRALVQNLVANALRYGMTGHRQADRTVEVRAEASGNGWELQVVDHGPGIPAEQRERLLEPLTRLERDVAEPGSGIGLATSRRVAQAHGGTLEIGDTPGGGTTVTVSVPT